MKPSNDHLVFIVDDDPDDRQIILDAFLENKYLGDYEFIESGESLLENLNAPSDCYPSLILLDLNMPGIMGLDVLREIRSQKHYSHIPIVVLTTSALHIDRKMSYELGANCFLRKPDSFADLVDLTDAILKLWLIDMEK